MKYGRNWERGGITVSGSSTLGASDSETDVQSVLGSGLVMADSTGSTTAVPGTVVTQHSSIVMDSTSGTSVLTPSPQVLSASSSSVPHSALLDSSSDSTDFIAAFTSHRRFLTGATVFLFIILIGCLLLMIMEKFSIVLYAVVE